MRLFALLSLAMLIGSIALAQSNSETTLSGKVLLDNGQPAAGASVEINSVGLRKNRRSDRGFAAFDAWAEEVEREETDNAKPTWGRRLADAHGALLCGSVGVTTDEHGGAVREEAGDDDYFAPDVELHDNWRAQGENWTLRALHTPGHTATHYCFALEEENALFCGDHVMAWSTSIVSPPDGCMKDYLASLERVHAMSFARLLPTHGAHIDNPGAFIEAYVAHRKAREAAILAQVSRGVASVREIVAALYADVDRALHPAAMHSVWAHLIHLAEQGIVAADPAPTLDAHYRPTKKRQEA